ncbi:DinB family protein [Pareuzebyella sediminis]|uniref:DinB family protein n=1 Tax=Pareuzebyella sediminis TaxID=2607998 RepID=UPI0011ECA6F0|nr:DinB family protein [Pareuzebyella sediminis]
MRTTALNFKDPYPFYKRYIDVLGDVSLLDMMTRQLSNFPEFITSIPDSKWTYRYAPDKWTVAQVLLHVVDSERIFQHRAFRFSRRDQTALPGFDQDSYAPNSGAENRSKASVIEEYEIVRKSSLSIFGPLDKSDLEVTGIASEMEWSVGALGFVICGHQKYHRNMLRDRYL